MDCIEAKLRGGKDSQGAFDETFARLDLDQLERSWMVQVGKLR